MCACLLARCIRTTEFQENYEATIADIASRLSAEDNSGLAVRDILQKQADKKEVDDFAKD